MKQQKDTVVVGTSVLTSYAALYGIGGKVIVAFQHNSLVVGSLLSVVTLALLTTLILSVERLMRK